MICDRCLHANICGNEGAFEEALIYCADFLGWIPVSERLPKVADCYNVTRQIGSDLIVDACFFDGINTWHNDKWINHERNYLTNIVAWMEKPQPYRGVESEG